MEVYPHTDMRLKEQALSRVTAPAAHPGRQRPDDDLHAILEAF